MVMELRPDKVRQIIVPLNVTKWQLEDLEALAADDTTQPVTLRLPTDTAVNTDRYAHVRSVAVVNHKDDNNIDVNVLIREWELS